MHSSPLVAWTAVRFKALFLCLSLFWYALLCVHSSFTIILKRKRELVALLLLSYGCLVLWLFLNVSWVGLQCVIVVFLGHTHLFFANNKIEIGLCQVFYFFLHLYQSFFSLHRILSIDFYNANFCLRPHFNI